MERRYVRKPLRLSLAEFFLSRKFRPGRCFVFECSISGEKAQMAWKYLKNIPRGVKPGAEDPNERRRRPSDSEKR